MAKKLIITATGERPLSEREAKRLGELEAIIGEKIGYFYEVGNALIEIRETRLFRQDYSSFKEYCKKAWDIGESRAYQLIDAKQVVDTIASEINGLEASGEKLHHGGVFEDGDSPKIVINERQARELARLKIKDDPEATARRQLDAWEEAKRRAGGGKVTARHIRAVIRSMQEGEVHKARRRVEETIDKSDLASDAYKRLYQALINQIEAERSAKWKATSKEYILVSIEELRNLVAKM